MTGCPPKEKAILIVLLTGLALSFLLTTGSFHAVDYASAAQKTGDASLLRQRATELAAQGRYDEAIPLAEQFVAHLERRRGTDPSAVARGLESLGGFYRGAGRAQDAISCYQRALALREKTEGVGHPSAAPALYGLGSSYRSAGSYGEAETFYKKALEVREKAFGRDHPDVAHSLNGLAYLYGITGNYQESEDLHKRALDIRERAFGRNHPDVAQSLHNLGWLYYHIARYADAETHLRKALSIREKSLGESHQDIVTSLQCLGRLYQATGRFTEAEKSLKRALELQERTVGRNHRWTAQTLTHLGWLYYGMKDYGRAEPLLTRSLEIRQRTPDVDRLNLAANLNNLGLLCADTGRYQEAEGLHGKALEIRRTALGEQHTYVAMSLANLASLYSLTGRFQDAEGNYRKALEIRENVLGRDHPDVALTVMGLAHLLAKPKRPGEGEEAFLGRQRESHDLFVRGLAIYDAKREDVFSVMSDRQKMSYMKTTQKFINAFLNHTASYHPVMPSFVRDALDVWIRWKGAVLEAQGRYIDAVTHSTDPRIQRRFDELVKVRREIARLALSGQDESAGQDSSYVKKEFGRLQKAKQRLEGELSTLSREYNLEKRLGAADSARIAGLLPEGSAYLDFALLREFDFGMRKSGKSQYFVFLLMPEKAADVRIVSLGDADVIHQHLTAYLNEMGKVKRGGGLPDARILRREARALYERIMKPLEPFLKDRTYLLLSPDGMLNLIPFEVMMTDEGKYLMEKHLITYAGAGRDIIRFTDETPSKARVVIMADPDYDMAGGAMEPAVRRGDAAAAPRDARALSFPRIPETKQEADAIDRIVSRDKGLQVMNYQRKEALEEVLFRVESPRILHLATHGYFFQEEELRPTQDGDFVEREDDLAAAARSNSMMRSGIVLAGVNTSLRQGRDEGLVSAEKILGLKLKGTDIVVLSACETAVGRASQGEGVFGLKRAFVLSGAKTLVMSLWSVPSEETAALMTDFYGRLAAGDSKAEALRYARIAMMKKQGNPFYWGAFVLVGKP